MRLIRIGKREFVFELEWQEGIGDDVGETVRDVLGEDVRGSFTVLKEKGREPVLGVARGETKGKAYSYAQALARAGRDGIFVTPAPDDRLWYVVISDGLVVQGTDRSMKEADAVEAVTVLRRSFDLPVFSSSDVITGAHDFDLEGAVAKVKVSALRRADGRPSQLLGAVFLIAVLCSIGFGGWYAFMRKPSDDAAAQNLEMMRAAYLASAQSALQGAGFDPSWVEDAYRHAQLHFIDSVGGWQLDGVTCNPGSCTANYSLPQGSLAYSIDEVAKRYGRAAVTVLTDQKSLTVSSSFDIAQPQVPAEESVFAPKPARGEALEAIGLVGMRFSKVRIDGEVVTEDLTTSLAAPPGTAQLLREDVGTGYDAAIDLVLLRGLASHMSKADFVARSISFSDGAGGVAPGWKIDWSRFHGGAP